MRLFTTARARSHAPLPRDSPRRAEPTNDGARVRETVGRVGRGRGGARRRRKRRERKRALHECPVMMMNVSQRRRRRRRRPERERGVHPVTARQPRTPAFAPVRAVGSCSVLSRSRVVPAINSVAALLRHVVGALREELGLLLVPFPLLRAPRLVYLRRVVLHRGDHHRSGGYARDDTPHAIAMRVRLVNQAPKPRLEEACHRAGRVRQFVGNGNGRLAVYNNRPTHRSSRQSSDCASRACRDRRRRHAWLPHDGRE